MFLVRWFLGPGFKLSGILAEEDSSVDIQIQKYWVLRWEVDLDWRVLV
jgi:hypothetical protein